MGSIQGGLPPPGVNLALMVIMMMMNLAENFTNTTVHITINTTELSHLRLQVSCPFF